MTGRYGHLINWAILVAGVAGIIYPAFFDERLGLTQIFISLFEPKPTLGFAMRWLSVVVLCGAAYILITGWIYQNLPISVIWTKLDVHFETPDGSRVRVEREQALRANQPGVTAYFMQCRPTSEKGRAPEHLITASVYCDGIQFEDSLELHGNDARGFEVTHLFGTPLPYAWYVLLTPISWLNREPQKLVGSFKRKIVLRRMSITYLNEFNVVKPAMNIQAAIYSQHNIAITFHMPHGRPLRDLRARRIKTNGVVDVSFRDQGNMRSLYIDRLQNEILRITWSGDVAANTP
jgi:hypothetical protein